MNVAPSCERKGICMNSNDKAVVSIITVVAGVFLTVAVVVGGRCFISYNNSHNGNGSAVEFSVESPTEENAAMVETPTQKVGVYIQNNYGEVNVNP